MSRTAVIRMVKSLSKVEKRQFKLATKKQAGSKDYLDLFDIIDQTDTPDAETIREKFTKLHPRASLDNTARYLLKVLTDCLIQTKTKDDSLFRLLHGLMRVNILQERSLSDEAYKELKKLEQVAVDSQNHFIQYMICRQELNYLSDHNFHGFSEKGLIKMQMKARDVLKEVRNTQEHYSLYELLKHRLIHSGKILSEEGKKQLDDLILSEMGLVTTRAKNNFGSQKLHLLFQSFFFTDIGDYRSALKTFYVLNKLFEENVGLWSTPPLDYFSSLDGILDSLRAIGYYEEMTYYIEKTEQLDNVSYPEYFRFLVRKTAMIYRLVFFLNTGRHEEAITCISNSDPDLLKAYSLIDDEKQSELLFYIASAYLKAGNTKKAQKHINEIVLTGKVNYQSVVYKAARLMGMIIHYENNNLDYLDYEIRSYKRAFQHKGKFLETEKIFLKAIKLHPGLTSSHRNDQQWKKIAAAIAAVEHDKYEQQLRKYFDFIERVRHWFGEESRDKMRSSRKSASRRNSSLPIAGHPFLAR